MILNPLNKKLRKKITRPRSGQSITEYAALLAFVAVLIATVFAFGPGQLSGAISAAFGAAAGQLNGLSSSAAN